jgi:hypothetical protein
MAIEPVPAADEPVPVAVEPAPEVVPLASSVLTSPLTTARPVERAATLLAFVLRPVAVEVDSAAKAI